MIGKLTGHLDNVSGSHCLLDVGGVGYLVTCSARTLRQMGPLRTPLSLWIETQVREDAINLFGFADQEEQEWFRLLTTVQGVGAKVALAILSVHSPEQVAQVIASQDKAGMAQADGVGPKLALRIVTELKDKTPVLLAMPGPPAAGIPVAGATAPGITGDAVSALVNLGYRRAEAFGAVAAIARQRPSARLDELIRMALAELSRKDHAA